MMHIQPSKPNMFNEKLKIMKTFLQDACQQNHKNDTLNVLFCVFKCQSPLIEILEMEISFTPKFRI